MKTAKRRKSIPSISAKRAASFPELVRSGRTVLPTAGLPPKRRLALELSPVGKTYLLKPKSKTAPARKAKPIQKSWIKKKPRTPEQFDRIYGPAEYQAFTRAQPCACCGWEGATEICHARNGGKSRKADWTETFAGCGPHYAYSCDGAVLVGGCNTEPERIGKRTFEAKIGKTLLELAAEHQAKYRAHVEAMAGA